MTTNMNPDKEDVGAFISKPPHVGTVMKPDQILKAALSPDFLKMIDICKIPGRDAKNKPINSDKLTAAAQVINLGAAAVIYTWRFYNEVNGQPVMAFISEQYATGYVFMPGKRDSRIGGLLLTSKEDKPIKGSTYDVYVLQQQTKGGIYRRSDQADEFYLKRTDFNGGTVQYHPADLARMMVGGQKIYVDGYAEKSLKMITRAMRRFMWRAEGLDSAAFNDAYDKMYPAEKQEREKWAKENNE